MGRLGLVIAVALVVMSSDVSAQETRRFGIVFGAPTSVGAQFRVNDRVSIRGEASVSSSTNETTLRTELSFGSSLGGGSTTVSTTTSRIEISTLPITASMLVTVARWEAVRLYTGGRLNVSRSSLSSERTTTRETPPPSNVFFEIPPIEDVNSTTVDWSLGVGGVMGTQYTPHERFAIFGEAGLNFSLPDEDVTEFGSSRGRGWGTSGRVGVILFVK